MDAIERLQSYKRNEARIKVLNNYSVGGGVYLSTLSRDDNLQSLHRQLKGLPSYMYLTEKEQRLETVAHAYLKSYPVGTRAQLEAVPWKGADAEDEKQLRHLRAKIKKVMEARGMQSSDFDSVIQRISELEDLVRENKRIDEALEALAGYKPEYVSLLRLRYVDGLEVDDIAHEMSIDRSTVYRRLKKAEEEYEKIFS
ncbi:DUF1492 domain-containing protein [Paenibacillus sp. P26]|nr:DUF1492 domain-containing protein [Paenibacillus sp. P26]UUZ93213.1 DUF1492 domain-containing protein [Paenibacillus sp. P25]